jgi:hypothetical protein
MDTPPVRRKLFDESMPTHTDQLDATSNTLREEIKAIHKAYREDIMAHQKHIRSQSIYIKDMEEMVNNKSSEISSLRDSITTYTETIVNQEQEKEQWIGNTLKFQYLFQQMDKVGLQQSEDIFDCFRDIEVPEVDLHMRENYVPTELTNAVVDDDIIVDDDSEDDLILDDESDDDIIGGENVGPDGDVIIPEYTTREIQILWRHYRGNDLINDQDWPIDHLQLAAANFGLDKPDMARDLQIHLVEECIDGIDIDYYVTIIQKIFRGYRIRKPWIDVAFP